MRKTIHDRQQQHETVRAIARMTPMRHRPVVSKGTRIPVEKKEMTKASQENSNGAEFDLTGAVPLEVKAGTLVLLHHALVHYSAPNTSSKSRHAYSVPSCCGRS